MTKSTVQLVGAICVLLAIALSACVPVQAPPSSEADDVVRPALAITAAADGFQAPTAVDGGWTEVTLSNESDGMRNALLLRFEEGYGMPELGAAVEAGIEGVPEFLTAIGGPMGVLPGMTGATTVNLRPGDYVMLDPVPDAAGVPGMAKGYIMPFTVGEAVADAAAPNADLSLEMVDYSFVLDHSALTAGRHTIEITNTGMEPHEVAIVELAPDTSVQDFLAAMAPDVDVPGPPPGMVIGGTQIFHNTETVYVTVELKEGKRYGLICFYPSEMEEHAGMPHFMLGMVGEFEVTEKTAQSN